MLHRAIQDLHNDDIVATDGRLGAVEDIYFDDRRWAVRYLVVDTGDWLAGRRVLIPAASVSRERITRDAIAVALTRDEVRQDRGGAHPHESAGRSDAAHLRSGRKIVGYSVVARDGTVGQVKDFFVDDRDWSIVDVVVDTRDWLSGEQVLVSPDAVESIDWGLGVVQLRLARIEIEHSPRVG